MYITYHAGSQTNAANSHIGFGRTLEESERRSLYWNNQFPVRTVAASRAPAWARRAYDELSRLVDTTCCLCGAAGKDVERINADFWRCPACVASK